MAEGGNAATLSAAAAAAAEVATEVRVVRCPKCKKLLPELVGVKVYRCGGCNAALQANKSANVMVMDKTLEKSDDVRTDIPEIPDTPSNPKEAPSNACKQTNQGSPRDELGGHENAIPGRDGDSSVNSASGIYSNAYRISNNQDRLNNYFPSTDGRHYFGSAQHRHPSEALVNGPCSNLSETIMADSEESRVSKMQGNSTHAGQKFCQSAVHKGREGEGASGPWRAIPSSSSQGIHFSPHPDEGPSNYRQSSIYCHRDVDSAKYCSPDYPDRVEHLEQDRADLLKKLDELRDQICRSCEITNGQIDKVRVDTRTVPTDNYEHCGLNDWFHEGPSSFKRSSMLKGPSSLNGPSVHQFPLVNGNDLNVQHYHPTLQNQDDIFGYREPFGSLPLRRTPGHLPHQFPERSSNNYAYVRSDPDSVMSHPHDAFYHQTTCSHSNIFNVPSRVPLTAFGNRRTPYLTNCHEFYPVDDPPIGGAGNYGRRNATSFLSNHPSVQQRPILKQQNGRWCHPLGGGAPFIVCSNCFQLMQVPHRLSLRDKDQHKLRCGSCSHVISFEVNGNHLVVSGPTTKRDTVTDPINDSSDRMAEVLQHRICRNGGLVYSESEEFIDPIYNTHSADEKFILSSPTLNVASHEMMEREYGSNSSGSENTEGLPLSYGGPKDGKFADPIIYHREVHRSAELPQKSDIYPRGGSVPLREHFGCSSFNHCGSRSETGSRSTRSEQDKLVSVNGNFKQNSMKDVLMATEMDFPVDEYPNPDMSQDSTEACEDELPRTSKGGESFLTGLIKKGFSRTNQSLENGKVKVSLNGHRIPDRLVKKAEKQSGPIQPGEYWYDYRAGFWGVMGQSCLGIIPPFIEEFNYPMPKNCSGGNTGVVVNGRELHQKDLELLAGRGLPTSRDSSYIIEISGRVLDAISGEELDCLGKLAPTVEKVKHGFGMRVPGVAAA